MKEIETNPEQGLKTSLNENPTCGIIMPISAIDGCTAEHWAEVKSILSEAIEKAGYSASLVSDANESGIIQKRIVQNIYDNEIVVCDVSGKNPNVMFELGMRLAFDKPTIIVIDDNTNYSFDTTIIEHISYPRDLHYPSIIKFKEKLKEKICATMKKAKEDTDYSTFLKNFGKFEVAHIESKKGSLDDVMITKLDDLSKQVNQLFVNLYTPNITIPNKLYEEDEFDNKEIKRLVKIGIESYMRKTNIPLSDLIKNENNERYGLKLFLENNQSLLNLCKRPQRLREAINDVLTSLV